ncbi:MAG: GNAT family N-acetyltransferase [Candidatus Nanopelagicaceae bacterium]|nr:GNAT family N-acetyltransferase [Candidatus Nanopelagicaceae bacterium]
MSPRSSDTNPTGSLPGIVEVGQRITLRLHDPEGGFRDVVGVLKSETTIEKRDGSLLQFRPEEVAVWRVITPPADRAGMGSPLSLRIRDIELAANATWPAKEQVQLGDWILRASGKFTKRANSVLAIGSPRGNVDLAIGEVIKFYNTRGLTPTFHVALPTYAELGRRLKERNWQSGISVNVMVADIEEVLGKSQINISHTNNGVEISGAPGEEWIALQNDHGVLEIMTRSPARYAAFRRDGKIVGVGRASNYAGWTVLTRLYVHPDERGKGLGRNLIYSLLLDAQILGATKVALQVDSKNLDAIALYEKMGFRLHHTYEYFSYNQEATVSGGC